MYLFYLYTFNNIDLSQVKRNEYESDDLQQHCGTHFYLNSKKFNICMFILIKESNKIGNLNFFLNDLDKNENHKEMKYEGGRVKYQWG
jgi:hypothetical protein